MCSKLFNVSYKTRCCMDDREKKIYKATLIGSAVNAGLVLLKFLAGIFGRSSAMVADAVHSLSDFATDLIVLVFVKIAGKPRDRSHDYGHGKFETFATLVIGLILVAAGIGLMANGIELVARSVRGQVLGQPSMFALIIALVSIVSKEWLYRYTMRRGRELNSPAVQANAWHHRSDAVSSAGTLVGIAGAMFLGERWRILDPLAAIVVSVLIIRSGYQIMKPCVGELLEASLPEEQQRQIREAAMSVPGIAGIHNLRTRRIGSGIAVDFHATMDGSITLAEAHRIASEVERVLKEKFGTNSYINVHMEPARERKADKKA